MKLNLMRGDNCYTPFAFRGSNPYRRNTKLEHGEEKLAQPTEALITLRREIPPARAGSLGQSAWAAAKPPSARGARGKPTRKNTGTTEEPTSYIKL